MQLEDQVAIRVQAELTEQNYNTPKSEKRSPKKTTNKEVSHQSWLNFMEYLPHLKSPESTKGLISMLDELQLREFADVLQRVVDGKF